MSGRDVLSGGGLSSHPREAEPDWKRNRQLIEISGAHGLWIEISGCCLFCNAEINQ